MPRGKASRYGGNSKINYHGGGVYSVLVHEGKIGEKSSAAALQRMNDFNMAGSILPPDVMESPYKPILPRSVSLGASEDKVGKGDSIVFLSQLKLPLSFEELTRAGEYVESEPLPLFHTHVLWSYAIRLMRGKGNKYSLSIVSNGSRLSSREKRGPSNDPPCMVSPAEIGVTLLIVDEECNIREELALEPELASDGSVVASKQFTKKELLGLAVSGHLLLHLYLTVPASYFTLSSIIDLEAKPPATVSATTRDMVAAILRGEKPPGADWEITGGYSCSDSPIYHVHKAAFARVSPAIQSALCNDGKLEGRRIELLEGDKGARFQAFEDDALKMAILIAYGLDVPLPQKTFQLGHIIMMLHLQDHFTKEVAPQWEREICRKALALDVRNPSSSSIVELLTLLDFIWMAPYGSFPVAKRVAIGVLADMMHLSAHRSVNHFVHDSVLPALRAADFTSRTCQLILSSMKKHLHCVSGVMKMIVAKPDSGHFPSGDGEEKRETEEEEVEEVKNTITRSSSLDHSDFSSGDELESDIEDEEEEEEVEEEDGDAINCAIL